MPADQRTRLKQWLDSGEAQLHPLTLSQRELWEVSPVPVADSANHICCLIKVKGKMAAEDGAGALQLVVDRQEALRVSFLPGRRLGPFRVFHGKLTVSDPALFTREPASMLDFVRTYNGQGVARKYQWGPDGELTTTFIWMFKVQ